MAPAADIIGLKVLDATGQGRASAVLSAVAWAVAPGTSTTSACSTSPWAVTSGHPTSSTRSPRPWSSPGRHGITVVWSPATRASSGPAASLSPGNSPYVITVGASDTRQTAGTSDDVATYYSSVGPTLFDEFAKPDVVAPGNHVISVRARGSYIDVTFSLNLIPVASYAATAGTEMGLLEPLRHQHVRTSDGRVVALLLSADPTLTPDDIKVRLMKTADPLPGATRYQQGAGVIDVAAALLDTSHAQGYALSEDLGDGMTVLDEDVYSAWDQRVWSKYGWTKFKWSKFKGARFHSSKFKWSKFKWSDVGWSKFKWSKFKWSDVAWSKFKWSDYDSSKFKWSDYGSSKFKWSDYDSSKFKWSDYDSSKFKWSESTTGRSSSGATTIGPSSSGASCFRVNSRGAQRG